MMYTYKILGETPSKKNSRITLKNGMNIPSKCYRNWHKDAELQIKKQAIPEKPIDSPVVVYLEFVHGDRRRRDSDNGTSSIMDLLQDCKVISDDNWQIIQTIIVTNKYDKGNAACFVTIIPAK